MIIFQIYFVLVQSGGGGGNLANTILEDEVMAEHNEDTSLLSACRNLMTSITKVRIYAVRYFPEGIFPSCNCKMCNFLQGQVCPSRSARPPACSCRGAWPPTQSQAVALGPHCSLRRLKGPNLTFGKLPFWKLQIQEGALRKMPLGKYITPNLQL